MRKKREKLKVNKDDDARKEAQPEKFPSHQPQDDPHDDLGNAKPPTDPVVTHEVDTTKPLVATADAVPPDPPEDKVEEKPLTIGLLLNQANDLRTHAEKLLATLEAINAQGLGVNVAKVDTEDKCQGDDVKNLVTVYMIQNEIRQTLNNIANQLNPLIQFFETETELRNLGT